MILLSGNYSVCVPTFWIFPRLSRMKSSHDLFVGIDLLDAASVMMGDAEDDVARKATKLHHLIQRFQESFTSIEKVM